MSFCRYTEIVCDGPGDVEGTCGQAHSDPGSVTEVRERARLLLGWITGQPGGQDFCSVTCRDNARAANR